MNKIALILALSLTAFSAVSCSADADNTAVSSTAQTTEAVTAEETTEQATETEVSETEPETEPETQAEESEEESNELDLSVLSTFEVTSDDLHDGVWDSDITNTSNGSNRSPQLSWDAVDGAGNYVIYMIDTTAGNWIHWRSVYEGETSIPAGWADEKEYVGPYPPEGIPPLPEDR